MFVSGPFTEVRALSDYLTQRKGYWHFVRRVPIEFENLDKRRVVKHSTKIEVAKDRRGIKAAKIADVMNRELEAYWRALSDGKAEQAEARYAEARRRARTLGFDYVETSELVTRPTVEILERLEKLLESGNLDDKAVRAAVLGYEKRPQVTVSEVFSKYEHITRTEVKDMSPNQLKRWKNGYTLAIGDFEKAIGDKDLKEITHDDILDYTDWLQDRVDEGEIVAKTANKYMGHVSRMIKEVNRKNRLGIPDLFAGMRLSGGKYVQRPSYPIEFVQNQILAEGALKDMNEEARRAIYLIADTGLRLSEAANLNENTIFLDADIPYIRVEPDGRRVKSDDSIREIPLVGVALAAMKLQPKGFPRYADKGASLSAYANGFLLDHGLRPTKKHTVYSLRHTFKDRLIEQGCQDSMIEGLLGHSDDHPKYGSGPSLKLKLEVMKKIAFKPPKVL
jgi:integrase